MHGDGRKGLGAITWCVAERSLPRPAPPGPTLLNWPTACWPTGSHPVQAIRQVRHGPNVRTIYHGLGNLPSKSALTTYWDQRIILVIAGTAGGVTVSEAGTSGQDQWKPGEWELRKDEVDNARRAASAQRVVGLCAVIATAIAAIGAWQAATAVNIAAKGIERQANADRLSTAVSAIGEDQPAQRVAGFGLLRRHVEDRVNTSKTPEERLDAYNLYTNAVDVLENYLRNPPQASTKPATEPEAGLGFGRPSIPYDNKYAARELQSLMRLKPEIQRIWNSLKVKPPSPGVDLSNVELFGQSWEGIDFAWLGGRYFPGIDLRGANLRNSVWGKSILSGAHLQCANLEGASFRGANLIGADFRGAHLYQADFTGATFTDASHKEIKLDGATNWDTARGLPWDVQPKPGVSRAEVRKGKDGIENCLDHRQYWEKSGAPAG